MSKTYFMLGTVGGLAAWAWYWTKLDADGAEVAQGDALGYADLNDAISDYFAREGHDWSLGDQLPDGYTSAGWFPGRPLPEGFNPAENFDHCVLIEAAL